MRSSFIALSPFSFGSFAMSHVKFDEDDGGSDGFGKDGGIKVQ